MSEDTDKIVKLIEGFQLGIGIDQRNFEQNYEAYKEYDAQLRVLECLRLNIILMGLGYTPPKPEKKEKK